MHAVALFLGITAVDPTAVVAELDRRGVGLWPGFDPRTTALLLYDGQDSYLFRHPHPPKEFQTVSPGVARMHGLHDAIRANTSAELDGVPVAMAILTGKDRDLREWAALLAHEAFHVYQRTHHPTWTANEADLFLYPFDDANNLAQGRLESIALSRALGAHDPAEAAGWASAAISRREKRYRSLGAKNVAYERGTELNEGLAQFVEGRAAGRTLTSLAPMALADDVRLHAYATGEALAMLLERLRPQWKQELERGETRPLDERSWPASPDRRRRSSPPPRRLRARAGRWRRRASSRARTTQRARGCRRVRASA